MTLLLGVLALVLLVWNFSVSAGIMNYLRSKGEKVNPALMHVRIFSSAQKYKQHTTAETGKPGKLYVHFVVSGILFALALFTGIISVL